MKVTTKVWRKKASLRYHSISCSYTFLFSLNVKIDTVHHYLKILKVSINVLCQQTKTAMVQQIIAQVAVYIEH